MIKLTEKELEVLSLAIKGMNNKQISEKIFITVYTVKAHLSSAMRKLGVTNRTEACYMVLKNHLIYEFEN